jgi:enoyl-CoA hydratase/carnithine racemase
MSDVVLVDNRGRVRILTLNRPRSKNAFNDDLYDAAREALASAADDPDVAVVVITGAEGAFSAGQDLGEMDNRRVHDDDLPHGFMPFIDTLQSFPKPLLAAVNGVAVGIGVTMLLHCDLVWVADGVRLRAPFVSLGIPTEAGSSALFPARIGWQAAAHMLFTAAFIDAEKAVEIGLAWRRSSPDRLLDDVMEVAEDIAANPVSALVANKRLLLEARLPAAKQARQREETALVEMVGAPANREAIKAFMEKRPPDFSNL